MVRYITYINTTQPAIYYENIANIALRYNKSACLCKCTSSLVSRPHRGVVRVQLSHVSGAVLLSAVLFSALECTAPRTSLHFNRINRQLAKLASSAQALGR